MALGFQARLLKSRAIDSLVDRQNDAGDDLRKRRNISASKKLPYFGRRYRKPPTGHGTNFAG